MTAVWEKSCFLVNRIFSFSLFVNIPEKHQKILAFLGKQVYAYVSEEGLETFPNNIIRQYRSIFRYAAQ